MPKVRADKLEYEKRLLNVQGWIIEGVTSTQIVQQIIANAWCTSKRHAERMLAAARDIWIEYEQEDLMKRRKLKLQQLQHLKRTLKDQYKGTPDGIRAQIAVEREIIKLDGLAAPVKIEVSGDKDKPLQQNITCEVIFKDYSATNGPKPTL